MLQDIFSLSYAPGAYIRVTAPPYDHTVTQHPHPYTQQTSQYTPDTLPSNTKPFASDYMNERSSFSNPDLGGAPLAQNINTTLHHTQTLWRWNEERQFNPPPHCAFLEPSSALNSTRKRDEVLESRPRQTTRHTITTRARTPLPQVLIAPTFKAASICERIEQDLAEDCQNRIQAQQVGQAKQVPLSGGYV